MVLERLITAFKGLCATFSDRRKGENSVYGMADLGMAVFATFFMQSPSFRAQQAALARGRGTSNCQMLFQMARIPTDNCIRGRLDPVSPEQLFPMFSRTLSALDAGGGLAPFQRLGGHVLIAVDGTRKRFFEELRVITTYPVFPSWSLLIETSTAGKPPPAVLGG